jgi:hypothetical protein
VSTGRGGSLGAHGVEYAPSVFVSLAILLLLSFSCLVPTSKIVVLRGRAWLLRFLGTVGEFGRMLWIGGNGYTWLLLWGIVGQLAPVLVVLCPWLDRLLYTCVVGGCGVGARGWVGFGLGRLGT